MNPSYEIIKTKSGSKVYELLTETILKEHDLQDFKYGQVYPIHGDLTVVVFKHKKGKFTFIVWNTRELALPNRPKQVK